MKDQVKVIIDDLDIPSDKKEEYWEAIIERRKKGVDISAHNGFLVIDESQQINDEKFNALYKLVSENTGTIKLKSK